MTTGFERVRPLFGLQTTAMLFLVLALLCGGCQTKVCDARGPSDMCEVHNNYMEGVKISYRQQPLPSRAYLEARVKYFPHAKPFLMSKECPVCVFYICDYCERAEQGWLQSAGNTR